MALLGACNSSGGGDTEQTGSASATMGTMGTTGTTGTTGATTGMTGATGMTGTTATTGGEPTTGGSVGQTDTGTSGATSPGTTTLETTGTSEGSSSGDSTGTGGMGGEGEPCVTAQDCQLADDCCRCEPLNPGEMAPACDIQACLQSACAAYNLVDAALDCRWGVCTFTKLTCNPLGVTCKSLPPECAPGDVPGVIEDGNGKCWTGSCLPAKACDWVPDCSYCAADDLVCVLKGQKGAYHVCEPKPLDCGPGEVDCDCGQQICDASAPHTICNDATPGIVCQCPFC